MPSGRTPEEWGAAYHTARPGHDELCEELERLLRQLLDAEGIETAQITSRTKSVESFTEKIRRKNDKYEDPLREITDLAGLRVIAYFPADVERIGALVESNFAVDWDHSRRQSGESDPDRFGYRSDHYVVRLSDARLTLPENHRFQDLVGEIQVRTVMQHAWAAVDHRLRYKNAEGLPAELRRRLYRLSALLEVADDEFAALQDAREQLEESYAADVGRGELGVPLDLLSLEALLQQTQLHELWAARALSAGYLPASLERVDLALLVWAFGQTGVTTLDGVLRFLANAEAWGLDYLASLRRISTAKGFRPVAVPSDILVFLVLRACPSDGVVMATSYSPPLQAALRELRTGTDT